MIRSLYLNCVGFITLWPYFYFITKKYSYSHILMLNHVYSKQSGPSGTITPLFQKKYLAI